MLYSGSMADTGVSCEENLINRFAQSLAANEKKIRDRGIKKLRRWLEARSHVNKGELLQRDHLMIWKGLHYCMWMSDKPLVQEDLAKRIAGLVLCFSKVDAAFLFIDAFFKTEAREWFKIDRLRLDKFMMLIRRLLRASLELVRQRGWQAVHVDRLGAVLALTVLSDDDAVPDGLKLHVLDIYVDELQQATENSELDVSRCNALLEPCCKMLVQVKRDCVREHILKQVFVRAIQLTVKARRVAAASGPTGGAKLLQFDLPALGTRLFELASHKKCAPRNRSSVFALVERLQSGKVDAAAAAAAARKKVRRPPSWKWPQPDYDEDAAAAELQAFEATMVKESAAELRGVKGVKGVKGRKRTADDASPKEMKRKKKKLRLNTNHDDENSDGGKKKLESVQNGDVSMRPHHIGNISEKTKLKMKQKKKKLKLMQNGDVRNGVADSGGSGEGNVETTPNDTSPNGGDDRMDVDRAPSTKKKTKKQKKKNKNPIDGRGDVGSLKPTLDATRQSGGRTGANKKGKRRSLQKPNTSPLSAQEGGGSPGPSPSVARSSAAVEIVEVRPAAWATKQTGDSLERVVVVKKRKAASLSPAGRGGTKKQFASFVVTPKPPAAFLKRAVAKATPKTEPKKASQKMTKDKAMLSNPSGKKRVIFAMSKNTSQEFCDRFSSSPAVTHNQGVSSPVQGILKSPLPASPKKKLFRARASDFF